MSRAVAKVDADAAMFEAVQREQVCIGQVSHMHIVADARAIRRGVIIAIHFKRRTAAKCRIDHQRNEVAFRPVVFSSRPFGSAPAALK